MPQTTSNWGKALVPGIKAWYGAAYDSKEEVGLSIFQKENSDRNYEEFVGVTGYGLYPVKTEGGAMSFDTMQQGYITRFTHVVYMSGFVVTREMNDDEQYNIMKQQAEALALAGRASRETVLANVLLRAETSGYTGGDGSYLLSATHAHKSGGTWSNKLGTDADLSETSLESAAIVIGKFTNDRGVIINAKPRKLIVADDNNFEACRILKSVLQNDSANNAVNALKAMNTIPEGYVAWSYINDDADAWFVLSNVPYGLVYVERDGDEAGASENDFTTENMRFKSRQRYSAGWVDPRGLTGSLGK